MSYKGEHYQDGAQYDARRARKEYICYRCGETIRKGDLYNRAYGLRFHERCPKKGERDNGALA